MGKIDLDIDYNLTKIYSIEPIINHPPEHIYYGSTTYKYLSSRMSIHRSDYRNWLESNKNFISVFNLFKTYGLDNCRINLIENYPCDNINEKASREGYYIRSNPCINKNIPGRTKKEWCRDTNYFNEYHQLPKYKDYQKEYHQLPKYKEYIKKHQQTQEYKDYQKEYKQLPKYKDSQKEYTKKRQQKQEYKDYQKQYYQKKKQEKNAVNNTISYDADNEVNEVSTT